MKTRGIDKQKRTLAYIWYERVWCAYNTQFLHAYDTKFVGVHMIRSFRIHMIRIPHNPNPTHHVAYTSSFLRINTTSFHFLIGYKFTYYDIYLFNNTVFFIWNKVQLWLMLNNVF